MLPQISFQGVVSEPAEMIARRRFKTAMSPLSDILPEHEAQLSYYSVSMCHAVQSALWKLGGDIKAVSDLLSIPMETLKSWKRKFPEFKTACEEGIRLSTVEIEKGLRSCAVPHDEVSEEDGPDGTKTTTKRNVVDTRAAIAVLKAKGDADWRDTKRIGGGITGNKIQVNFNSYAPGAKTQPTTVTVEAKPIETDEDPDGSD